MHEEVSHSAPNRPTEGYTKRTFPLALAYALTGHKSQGQTLHGLTVLDVEEAFAPGLMYVALSRVQARSNLRLLRPLAPDMFAPMVVPGM